MKTFVDVKEDLLEEETEKKMQMCEAPMFNKLHKRWNLS